VKKLIPVILFLWATQLAWGQSDEYRTLTIFFTNDVHGGIVPQKAEFLNPDFPPMLGGGASAAAIIKKVRQQAQAKGNPVLLIDAGDTFQGTLVGTLSKGRAVVEYMNMMHYDAVTPGNHDFDLGKDNLSELIQMSRFPWVSANIYDTRTGEPWKWLKPYVIIEKEGMRIGITGVTTTGTAHMSYPENIKGLEFRNEIISLQAAVDSLRSRGVDLVVALVHTGLPYDPKEGYRKLRQSTRAQVINRGHINAMEIAHYVKGIDILLGGHLHKGYPQPWEDPVNHTICLQNYANGGNLGWVDFTIHWQTKTIAGYHLPVDQNDLLLLQEDQFWPDSVVAAFLAEQEAKYEKGYREVIGQASNSLTRSSVGEAPLNNLIADVMRERSGADFAFMNFGGIRADIKAGPVTREDIFKVLPFGNEIVSFHCSGLFLKTIIERKVSGGSRGLVISGGKVIFNKNLPDGQRVVYMEVGGVPLEPDKIYRVATNDYLLEGNSGLYMLKDIPRSEVDFSGVKVGEALIDYFQKHSPVAGKVDGRWKRDNSAQPSEEWLKKFPPQVKTETNGESEYRGGE